MQSFAEMLKVDGVILIDGALGTEISRRGVATGLPLWSAAALDTAPEIVLDIHRAYVDAGAHILIANTFRTTAHIFGQGASPDGKSREQAQEAFFSAIELARSAASGKAWVAASFAPVGDCYAPNEYVGAELAAATYGDLAAWSRQAGADLIVLETQITLEEAEIAMAAARATNLPVLASFLIDESLHLWGGASLTAGIRAAEKGGAAAVLVNCITLPVSEIVLPALVAATDLPVGIYANAGVSQPARDGSIDSRMDDTAFVTAAQQWVALGAKLIGGCCGTTPATIAALAAGLGIVDHRQTKL